MLSPQVPINASPVQLKSHSSSANDAVSVLSTPHPTVLRHLTMPTSEETGVWVAAATPGTLCILIIAAAGNSSTRVSISMLTDAHGLLVHLAVHLALLRLAVNAIGVSVSATPSPPFVTVVSPPRSFLPP